MFNVVDVEDRTIRARVSEHLSGRWGVIIPMGGLVLTRLYLDVSRGTLGETLPVVLGVAVVVGFVAFLVVPGQRGEAMKRLRQANGRGGVVFSIDKKSGALSFDRASRKAGYYDYLWLDRGQLWALADDGSKSLVEHERVELVRGLPSGKVFRIRLDDGPERLVKVYSVSRR